MFLLWSYIICCRYLRKSIFPFSEPVVHETYENNFNRENRRPPFPFTTLTRSVLFHSNHPPTHPTNTDCAVYVKRAKFVTTGTETMCRLMTGARLEVRVLSPPPHLFVCYTSYFVIILYSCLRACV